MEVLQRTANRGSISTGEYEIDNSLKFEADNTEYLSKTPSSAGNRKTWTLSVWIKRTELASSASMQILSAGDTYLHFDADKLKANFRSAGENFFFATNRVFRDTSAWYHIVLQCDTTQGTDTNRAKLWVNGESQTADWLNSYSNMSQNYETLMNNDNAHRVGMYLDGSTPVELFNGYMAEMHLVDGTALEPTSFGEFDDNSGIWKPKAYAGSHGTNGFYLDFEDSANLGNDASGGTDFAETNIAAADQATDTPTNSFCTLNPIFQSYGSYDELTISEGATRAVNAASAYKSATSTIGVSTGKWYWEVNVTDRNTITTIGVTMPFYWDAGNAPFGGTVYYGQTGQRHNNSVAGGGQDSFGNGYTDGDIISFALDMDATTPTLAVRKNNSLVTGNNAAGNLMYDLSLTGSSGTFLPPKEDFYFAKLVGYGANTFDINFGGYTAASISSAATDENGYGTFEYAPPSGYYSICTKNLAEYG